MEKSCLKLPLCLRENCSGNKIKNKERFKMKQLQLIMAEAEVIY